LCEGDDFVAGRNRVPRPPTGKIAVLTGREFMIII
jgi:hypothetical protein